MTRSSPRCDGGGPSAGHPKDRDRLRRSLRLHRQGRSTTLTLVAGLEQHQLDFRPGGGRWSIGEVLDHLILADGLARRDLNTLIELAKAGEEPVIRRSLADLDVSVFGLPKALLPLAEIPLSVVSSLMPDSVRDALGRSRWIPVANPASAQPTRGRPGDVLRRGLRGSLAETEALLAAHPELDYRRLRRRDALLGIADVPAILSFLAAHEARHQGQIFDVLQGEGFPASI